MQEENTDEDAKHLAEIVSGWEKSFTERNEIEINRIEAKNEAMRIKMKDLVLLGDHGEDFTVHTKDIWLTCKRWLYSFGTRAFDPAQEKQGAKKWLWLAGPTNSGKTFCAERALLEARTVMPPSINGRVYFDEEAPYDLRPPTSSKVNWYSLRGGLRDKDSQKYKQAMLRCTDADLLLLDDIGGESSNEKISDWELRDLDEIMDCRSRGRGKWTIITSQKTMDQIGAVDLRIKGRIDRMTSNLTRWEAQ